MKRIYLILLAMLMPGVAFAADAAPKLTFADRLQALFFWIMAAATIGGAILVLTRRNLVTAVMFLVGTFLAISALYVTLYAHFLAVIQVLVYAGAIMVLFVFVVMILNKEEEEPWAIRGVLGKGLAGVALVYLTVRLVGVLWKVPAHMPEVGELNVATYGTTVEMGRTLFTTFLFPFEAVSIVLLVAVVGALVLAHPAHPNVGEEEPEAPPPETDTEAAH
jgi:NADH-quinone oxidoreductase subunit J